MENFPRKVFIGGNWKCNGDKAFVNSHCVFLNGLQFDTNKCEVSYTASFGQEYNNVSDIKQLQKCLEWYDTIITKIGVGDLTIPNVVKTNGKNRKNITPITLKDFAGIIRHTLSKEN